MPRAGCVVGSVLVLAALVIGGVLLVSGDGRPCPPVDTEAVNVQQRLTSTNEGIEFELWSSMPFPVRALPPILRIGDRRSSRHPDDGRLDTLILLIDLEDFESLTASDPVAIYHSAPPAPDRDVVATDGADVWTFGALRTDLLDCVPPRAGRSVVCSRRREPEFMPNSGEIVSGGWSSGALRPRRGSSGAGSRPLPHIPTRAAERPET